MKAKTTKEKVEASRSIESIIEDIKSNKATLWTTIVELYMYFLPSYSVKSRKAFREVIRIAFPVKNEKDTIETTLIMTALRVGLDVNTFKLAGSFGVLRILLQTPKTAKVETTYQKICKIIKAMSDDAQARLLAELTKKK